MAPGREFSTLTVAGGEACATVRREHARGLCEGHFPGESIVPGAYLAGLMADLGARLLAAASAAPPALAALERCVFLARVRPEDEILVRAWMKGGTQVAAEVRTRGACAARATLRFGERG